MLVKKLVLAPAAAAVALAVVGFAFAKSPETYKLSATLNAKQEIPKQAVKDAKAKGSFSATLTGTKLKFTLTYSGLTGAASAAHIHLGKAGKSGNVLVPLCPPCKSKITKTVKVPKSLSSQAE